MKLFAASRRKWRIIYAVRKIKVYLGRPTLIIANLQNPVAFRGCPPFEFHHPEEAEFLKCLYKCQK